MGLFDVIKWFIERFEKEQSVERLAEKLYYDLKEVQPLLLQIVGSYDAIIELINEKNIDFVGCINSTKAVIKNMKKIEKIVLRDKDIISKLRFQFEREKVNQIMWEFPEKIRSGIGYYFGYTSTSYKEPLYLDLFKYEKNSKEFVNQVIRYSSKKKEKTEGAIKDIEIAIEELLKFSNKIKK